ncbi:hypothetical protein HOD02_04575 [bacterium]|nr:hypothetical protein [bacterium]
MCNAKIIFRQFYLGKGLIKNNKEALEPTNKYNRASSSEGAFLLPEERDCTPSLAYRASIANCRYLAPSALGFHLYEVGLCK